MGQAAGAVCPSVKFNLGSATTGEIRGQAGISEECGNANEMRSTGNKTVSTGDKSSLTGDKIVSTGDKKSSTVILFENKGFGVDQNHT
ncbi:hypothetical protein [Mesobacillus selenatarsenatis]|uniref:Uncharacterized protein n=1 Tax=Mesobacillus selenatarsenatis (strain DSM 18680 / JCM 14380 / FERM P-15431 / SF-1) TaxID=1321606 RepID=A0A0A8X067_MESS1|nr:hypothetical protein [Mesobacillus selenatarsenatis]GAM12639.1 hypothetical protein SAMD00020551_0774 [Mesobacillus selenatarsenatis SF-1]